MRQGAFGQQMSKIACLFPGQGSQSVGMGKDLYDSLDAARQAFEEIDAMAGRSLSTLCFQGPDWQLKRTVNTQPTILAVSLAAWRCFESAGGPVPDFVAGHSLGEFTALVAAGVLTPQAAVALVGRRAQLMEDCPAGAMSAVIGLAPEVLEKCCADACLADPSEVVVVANFNTREQLVISGAPPAVAKAGESAKALGGKVIPLPVGGAFHSPLMAAAAAEFERELAKYPLADARLPVVQNFDAGASRSALEIKAKLARQMASSVRWCESIEYMLGQGVDTFVEIGPGKALAGMVKKIDRGVRVLNVFDYQTLVAAIRELAAAPATRSP